MQSDAMLYSESWVDSYKGLKILFLSHGKYLAEFLVVA